MQQYEKPAARLLGARNSEATVEIVIPVYNEERELPGCIRVLHEYLSASFPYSWSITIADNASTDGTAQVSTQLAASYQNVRALRLETKGRGFALRYAWSRSEADIVAYMDVDLSTGLNAFLPLVAPLANGHSDLSIGSRLMPGARTTRSPQRELISRSYNALARLTHHVRFSDAQCGFKAARTAVVRPLLTHVRDNNWFFDTELLLLAEYNGLRVHEVPVDWVEDSDSRVNVLSTAWEDIRGLVRVAYEKARGGAVLADFAARPEPEAANPAAVTIDRNGGLFWQIVSFGVIGGFSTLLAVALYVLFRNWSTPPAANLAALTIATLFNTEANRRFTFFDTSGSARRIHFQGLIVFALYYAFTTGALMIAATVMSSPSRMKEVAVLLSASAVGTALRFLALRSWVFSNKKSRHSSTKQEVNMSTTTSDAAVTSDAPSQRKHERRRFLRLGWQHYCLIAICALAGVLYTWRIWSEGWGNDYYAAAVKSMSMSFQNFIFGAFDPAGVVTVDKPPLAFWPQIASAAVFGYHGWALLLPQAIEGVLAVLLLHRAVRWWAGERVALLAALIMALSPITVAINRDNNPDTMMIFLLMAAVYTFSRFLYGADRPSIRRWLLMFTASFLGLAFTAKMLQAWVVLPAFALVYVIHERKPWRRMAKNGALAATVLIVSSMWWVALVDLWPGEKPYIGGSQDGSALNLIIGYNGLGRVTGNSFGGGFGEPGGQGAGFGPSGMNAVGQPGAATQANGSGQYTLPAATPGGFAPPNGSGPGGPGGGAFAGATGITRLFGNQLGGQISWLLPLCLLILLAVAIKSKLRLQVKGLYDRGGWLLWGSWLLLCGIVFSYSPDIHPYYSTQMAPAIAALAAAGFVWLWQQYRARSGWSWLMLPAGIAITAGWAWVLISRDTSWNGWLRYAVLLSGILTAAGMLVVRLVGEKQMLARLAGVFAFTTLLLAPGAWSVATAFAQQEAMAGVNPMAGPANGMPGGGQGPMGGLANGMPGGIPYPQQTGSPAYQQTPAPTEGQTDDSAGQAGQQGPSSAAAQAGVPPGYMTLPDGQQIAPDQQATAGQAGRSSPMPPAQTQSSGGTQAGGSNGTSGSSGVSSSAGEAQADEGMPPTSAGMPNMTQPPQAGMMAGPMPGSSRGLNDQQQRILDYVTSHANGARIALAVEGGAMSSASFIINSDSMVIGMGGFMGTDPAPSVNQLEEWTSSGELRFVLAGSGMNPVPGLGAGAFGGVDPGAAAPGRQSTSERDTWVKKNCKVVDPSEYGGNDQQQASGFTPIGGGQTLYDCSTTDSTSNS